MQEEKNVTKAVAESVERTKEQVENKSSHKKEETTVEMSSGVVFKIKEVPQFAYVDLRNSFPEPMPPVVYNEEVDRQEPNPEDPRYKVEYSNWATSLSAAITDLNIALGTDIESIPDGVPQPDSEDFRDKLQMILTRFGWSKEDIKQVGKITRYLYWVKYEAAKSGYVEEGGDLNKLILAVNRKSGVPEEDVQTAVEKFPN
jgi:hypothetical protein